MHKGVNDYEINKQVTAHSTGNILLSSVENSVTMTVLSVLLYEFKYKMT